MKSNYRFKSLIVSMILIGSQAFFVCSQEERLVFKPEIVTEQDNFNEKYSDLAQGFHLIGKEFQNFMIEKMLGCDSYEMVIGLDGLIVSLLDNTLMHAQEEIKKNIGEPFCDTIFAAVENNTDLHDIQNQVFGYTLKTEFLEPELKKYVNTYRYIYHFNSQMPLLALAIKKNNLQIMQFLIDIGADVNLPNSYQDNQTPLEYAILKHKRDKNSIDAVKLLLHAQGINVNQSDKNGKTPLYKAVQEDLFDIVQLLLDRSDIKCDESDKVGQTPLHKAVMYYDNRLFVQALIRKGANINKQDSRGDTPLHNAVYDNRMFIVPILLAASPDMMLRNSRNEVVADMARTEEMRVLLMRYLVRRAAIKRSVTM